jgi:hypothetical protein
MIDVREDILARLLEIVATIPNIVSAQRNNVDISENQLPAAIVFDGDEETTTDKTMPMLVTMTPEIIIAQQASEVGSDLSILRRELIKRVLYDIELNEQIVKTGRYGNGAIRYLSCQTDLGWMRSLHGALRAQFMFKYVLNPADL